MRCLETALGLALLALGATAWSPSCVPCTCDLLDSLRTAWCKDTGLTSVPPFPVDTQHIWIERENNISSLQGKEFDGYTNLTHIYLQHNPLTELPSGIFSKTINVTVIGLDFNKIKILQSHLFSNLMYLKKVFLSENQISVIEVNCFFNVPRLNVIGLYSNRLTKINQNFINDYSSLEILYLDDNPVHCDDSICELMNLVLQRKLYEGEVEEYMPRCAGPPSVQNRTWVEAVEAQWGAGPERCPRRVDTALKELLMAELNNTNNEMRALQEAVRELVRGQEAFKAEVSAARTEARRELQQELRQAQHATNALFQEQLSKTNSEVRRVLQEQEQVRGALEVLGRGQQAASALCKAESNETRGELRGVKEELHSGHLALKGEVLLLQEQTKKALQGKDAANILFKEVYRRRSGAQGVLLLRYSVLPGPDTTQPPT